MSEYKTYPIEIGRSTRKVYLQGPIAWRTSGLVEWLARLGKDRRFLKWAHKVLVF